MMSPKRPLRAALYARVSTKPRDHDTHRGPRMEASIEALVARLVGIFTPTRKVEVIWTSVEARSYATAYRRRYQIRISKNPGKWSGSWQASIAHEFAHIVTFSKSSRQHGTLRRYEDHGQEFYESLREVIRALPEIWPQESDYPWAKEYYRLYLWALRDGLANDAELQDRQRRLDTLRKKRATFRVGMRVRFPEDKGKCVQGTVGRVRWDRLLVYRRGFEGWVWRVPFDEARPVPSK